MITHLLSIPSFLTLALPADAGSQLVKNQYLSQIKVSQYFLKSKKRINKIFSMNLLSVYVQISWTNDENLSKDLPATK